MAGISSPEVGFNINPGLLKDVDLGQIASQKQKNSLTNATPIAAVSRCFEAFKAINDLTSLPSLTSSLQPPTTPLAETRMPGVFSSKGK